MSNLYNGFVEIKSPTWESGTRGRKIELSSEELNFLLDEVDPNQELPDLIGRKFENHLTPGQLVANCVSPHQLLWEFRSDDLRTSQAINMNLSGTNMIEISEHQGCDSNCLKARMEEMASANNVELNYA